MHSFLGHLLIHLYPPQPSKCLLLSKMTLLNFLQTVTTSGKFERTGLRHVCPHNLTVPRKSKMKTNGLLLVKKLGVDFICKVNGS